MPQGRKEKAMNSKQKQKKINRNVSIVLAVLIIATLCVTIAALTAAKRKDDDTKKPQNTTPNVINTTPQGSSQSSSSKPTPSGSSSSDSGSEPAIKVVEWHSPATGSVIKSYSSDVPVFSLTMEDYRTHMGVDISGDAGDDVLAAADGIVEDIYYDPMMGQTIIISHENGYTSIYQNLQTSVPDGIAIGAGVKGGEKIGSMGDTALIEISDSPHLHFSVKLDNKYTDPLSFITVTAPVSSLEYEDKGA